MTMTKAQQQSLARLSQAIATIEELVAREAGRSCRQRRQQLEGAHETLRLHGSRLGIAIPRLSFFYDPQQFLDHARLVADQLQSLPTKED